MGATWVDEGPRKIVTRSGKDAWMLFAGRGIIMVIFHRASVCPDHFPFNENLGLFLLFLDLNSEPSDSDCRRILA